MVKQVMVAGVIEAEVGGQHQAQLDKGKELSGCIGATNLKHRAHRKV